MELNAYQQKIADKRERYADLATRSRSTSVEAQTRASKMASVIPFGQPILVGHHSENRDRNYRARIGATMNKAIQAQSKAAHYEDKAESYGTHMISSDDPEALMKLRKKLEGLEATHEKMKAVNKAIKVNKTVESRIDAIVNLGYTVDAAEIMVTPVKSWQRIGFATFELTNSNGRMKSVKDRIAVLERNEKRQDEVIQGAGFTCKIDKEENRVMFEFEGMPCEETRAILKSNAFKWSPTRSAWVRQLTGNAIYAARVIIKELNEFGIKTI